MPLVKVKPVRPYQYDFLMSTKPKAYLSAGYGAGKTFILVMKMFQLLDINRGMPGGILVPNMKMFKRDVKPTIEELCRRFRIPFRYISQEAAYWFPSVRAKVYIFHSEDHGESIRGPNLAWFIINEASLVKEGAFKAALARVRLKHAKLRQVAMSGTPEGFNWAYDYFIADAREDTDLIFGDSRLNNHVAEDYTKMLLDSYDDLMAKMYVEGQYVNLNGLSALYQFNRLKHTADDVEPDLNQGRILVPVDFNVSPFAATLYTWNPMTKEMRGFDEINIENNADTHLFCRVLKQKLLDYGIEDLSEVELFPDPAGGSRSTRSPLTDIHILEEQGFTNLKYKSKIKSVRDCLNSANGFIKKNTLILDRKKCKTTIKDYEQTVMKGGTFELEKKDLKRTHWVDGFKNMCDYEFPVDHIKSQWRSHKVR